MREAMDRQPPERRAAKSAPEEPWLRVVRAQLQTVRAPESLRARITAMLAVERELGP